MYGFGRNIRYGINYALRVFAYTIIVSILGALYFFIINGNMEFNEFLYMFATSYVAMFGCIFVIIYGVTGVATVFLQQIVSGSTRRHAAMGYIFSNTLAAVLIYAFVIIVNFVCGDISNTAVPSTRILLFGIAYLFSLAVSSFGSAIVLKLGKFGFIAFIVLMYIVGGASAFILLNSRVLGEKIGYYINPANGIIFAAILAVIGSIFFVWFTRKIEVKI